MTTTTTVTVMVRLSANSSEENACVSARAEAARLPSAQGYPSARSLGPHAASQSRSCDQQRQCSHHRLAPLASPRTSLARGAPRGSEGRGSAARTIGAEESAANRVVLQPFSPSIGSWQPGARGPRSATRSYRSVVVLAEQESNIRVREDVLYAASMETTPLEWITDGESLVEERILGQAGVVGDAPRGWRLDTRGVA